MEAFELRAYEVLGYWTVVLIRVIAPEEGEVQRELLYHGDHVPIDDEDPQIRAVLVLSQVVQDLEWDLAQQVKNVFSAASASAD